MLTNKCYITAKYLDHYNDFIYISLNGAKYILYIGNFKQTDKIINKLKNNVYLNAICRIRYVYEPDYPIFNLRLDPHYHAEFTSLPNSIWLEAIKITALPEAKLSIIQEKSYFTLQDNYTRINPYLVSNKLITPPQIDETNQERIVTIHGKLGKEHSLTTYRILKVEGAVLSSSTESKSTDPLHEIPEVLRKFFENQTHVEIKP